MKRQIIVTLTVVGLNALLQTKTTVAVEEENKALIPPDAVRKIMLVVQGHVDAVANVPFMVLADALTAYVTDRRCLILSGSDFGDSRCPIFQSRLASNNFLARQGGFLLHFFACRAF